MDLEFHQLELRYERLRTRRPGNERRLLASLADIGQQVPVVVVRGDATERFVLVDGYKRVRALKRLKQDTVGATCWDLSEAEALLLERLMRTGEGETPLEQAWFLRELSERFSLSLEELGRRFGRSPSWVSRRLALASELPESVQEQVRQGELPAHAAMRYLVPLARANPGDCQRLVEGLAGKGVSNRQIGELYEAWRDGIGETRERVLSEPMLFLQVQQGLQDDGVTDGCRSLLRDLDILASVARRCYRRLRDGVLRGLVRPEREEVSRGFSVVEGEIERLEERLREEQDGDAGSVDQRSGPGAP